MSERADVIRREFQRFEASLRIARWAAIDAALVDAGLPELTSPERDVIDLGAAMGLLPELPADGDNDAADAGETIGATSEEL